jgi:hypothetical protein
VGLDRARSVEIGARACAARDRLIILIARIAEGEIVHRALARRERAAGGEQGVGDHLAGLDVAGDDRGGESGIQHRAFGHSKVDRPKATVVHRDRIVDEGAEDVERGGATDRIRRVEIVRLLIAGSGEIDDRRAGHGIDGDGDRYAGAIVHLVGEGAVLQPADQPPDGLLGIGHDVAHVGVDRLAAIFAGDSSKLGGAARAGGDLGLDIGDVAVGISGRPVARSEQGAKLGFEEAALVHEKLVVEKNALLEDRLAVGRHRSRRDPADIGMVTARGDEPGRVRICVGREDREDDRDVGKMGATPIGGVEHVSVARLHAPAVARLPVGAAAPRLDNRPDRIPHRSEMDRDVGGVGDQGAGAVEQGAGEIEPLLDVHR